MKIGDDLARPVVPIARRECRPPAASPEPSGSACPTTQKLATRIAMPSVMNIASFSSCEGAEEVAVHLLPVAHAQVVAVDLARDDAPATNSATRGAWSTSVDLHLDAADRARHVSRGTAGPAEAGSCRRPSCRTRTCRCRRCRRCGSGRALGHGTRQGRARPCGLTTFDVVADVKTRSVRASSLTERRCRAAGPRPADRARRCSSRGSSSSSSAARNSSISEPRCRCESGSSGSVIRLFGEAVRLFDRPRARCCLFDLARRGSSGSSTSSSIDVDLRPAEAISAASHLGRA